MDSEPATSAAANERLGRLVDRRLYNTDAMYHAEVRRFQHLLDITRMAMEDEGVDPRVIDRVLNRIVYGVPDGADAYERIDKHREEVRRLMTEPVRLYP